MLPEELHHQVSSRPDYAELEARYAQIVQKRTFQPLVWRLKRHREAVALGVGSPLILGVLLLSAYMFLPQSIHYAFADQKSCTGSPTIFPSLLKTNSSTTFTLSHEPTISIGHTPIFSYRLCAIPNHRPMALASYIDHQWVSEVGLHIGKSIKVVTPGYPVAFAGSLGTKAIPIEKPLVFKLNSTDGTFNYAVVANERIAACSKQQTNLSCSLAPLKLNYAADYHVALVRVFHGQTAGTVLSKSLQTITATAITQTSIGAGTTVYSQPQQITINTNKTITDLQTVSLTTKNANGTMTSIPITSSFKGQTITVNIASPLARKTAFDLHVNNLTASDESMLEQPYDLAFTTSGGPKAINDNIPSYGLASGQTMAVTFDQALNPAQDPNQFANLLVNGTSQPATISISGQQLIIKPTSSYPVCASVKVQISAVAQNIYGVAGDSAWSYTSRSHCYTTYSIGTSVQGRPIIAYQFGSGPSMVLYIAAMEGNEQNSAQLLQQWIPNIDANPGKISSNRTIVVIPQINPDGYAADTRLNAAGIDLNRNFPANNWQTQVTEPLANNVWTNDGGPSPLSAPESQALASFYEAHRPRLTLTMHSHGGIVEANDAGDSIALGAKYASLAGYRAIPTSAIGNFFDYTTTGAFEDWANDKLGLPVLEVELESPTAAEYARNLPALWAMAQVSP
jgi:protein MpaA